MPAKTKTLCVPISSKLHSVNCPKGCNESTWRKADRQLRAMLTQPNVPRKHWARHDDVNLIELYFNCPNDLAFIEFWVLGFNAWQRKYNPTHAEAIIVANRNASKK